MDSIIRVFGLVMVFFLLPQLLAINGINSVTTFAYSLCGHVHVASEMVFLDKKNSEMLA